MYRPVTLQLGCLLVQPETPPASSGDGARVGVLVSRDESEKSGLAGAVAAHQNGVVVSVDGEARGGEEALTTE